MTGVAEVDVLDHRGIGGKFSDEIGREAGYEDGASFRRLFRRLAGMCADQL